MMHKYYRNLFMNKQNHNVQTMSQEGMLYQITVRKKTVFSQVLNLMFGSHQHYLTFIWVQWHFGRTTYTLMVLE
jgi:hypothetical protein